MNLLVIPDIFGCTPAIDTLVKDLLSSFKRAPGMGAWQIQVLNPYAKGEYFRDEQKAYAHFCRHTDIPSYGRRIHNAVSTKAGPWFLLGFSAGASAAWHLSGSPPQPRIHGALCFYGSQIRHFARLDPSFDIDLVFPDSEPHFDVKGLARDLCRKPRVRCRTVLGQHGFMNAFSQNFDPELYKDQVETGIPDALRRMGQNHLSSFCAKQDRL